MFPIDAVVFRVVEPQSSRVASVAGICRNRAFFALPPCHWLQAAARFWSHCSGLRHSWPQNAAIGCEMWFACSDAGVLLRRCHGNCAVSGGLGLGLEPQSTLQAEEGYILFPYCEIES